MTMGLRLFDQATDVGGAGPRVQSSPDGEQWRGPRSNRTYERAHGRLPDRTEWSRTRSEGSNAAWGRRWPFRSNVEDPAARVRNHLGSCMAEGWCRGLYCVARRYARSASDAVDSGITASATA